MEWHIEGFTRHNYDVARAHANKMEDTCAFTVGMLIMAIDAANEQIAKFKAVSPPSEGAGNAEKLIDELLATRSHDIVSFIDKQKWIKVASRYLSSPSPVSEEGLREAFTQGFLDCEVMLARKGIEDRNWNGDLSVTKTMFEKWLNDFRSRSHT